MKLDSVSFLPPCDNAQETLPPTFLFVDPFRLSGRLCRRINRSPQPRTPSIHDPQACVYSFLGPGNLDQMCLMKTNWNSIANRWGPFLILPDASRRLSAAPDLLFSFLVHKSVSHDPTRAFLCFSPVLVTGWSGFPIFGLPSGLYFF